MYQKFTKFTIHEPFRIKVAAPKNITWHLLYNTTFICEYKRPLKAVVVEIEVCVTDLQVNCLELWPLKWSGLTIQ